MNQSEPNGTATQLTFINQV